MNMYFHNDTISKEMKKGFTLVEVLVSVAIFTMTMLVATGAVFTVVNANKKSHSLKSVMTNLNFALETMMRDVRVGSSYNCLVSGSAVGNCPTGGSGIRFTSNADLSGNGSNDPVQYTFNTTDHRIYKQRLDGYDPSPVPITASEIYIEDMKFYVVGAATGDGQPRILLTISGYVGVGDSRSTFNIQTTVSQRIIDPS